MLDNFLIEGCYRRASPLRVVLTLVLKCMENKLSKPVSSLPPVPCLEFCLDFLSDGV